MPRVVDSRRKDRPSRNYVGVYISQYNQPTVQRVFYRGVESFFRDDGNERGREKEERGNEKAEAEEKSGRESVDLLLKRPAGNNGRCATRDGCSLQTRTRDT